MSPYSVYARDDYKRCVCEKWGEGADSCPLDDSAPEPTPPIPTPDGDENDFDPDELDFGVMCTNVDDGLCGSGCDECHWSWPKSDADGCGSKDAACRCKPTVVQDFTFVTRCIDKCDSSCTDCRYSWPSEDSKGVNSSQAGCRCADGAEEVNFWP